jgi:hypothetical protein
LVETAIGRYKSLIDERLRSHGDAARRAEAVVGAAVLNCMLDAARPNSVRRSAFGGTGIGRWRHRPAKFDVPPCTNATSKFFTFGRGKRGQLCGFWPR